MKLEKDQKCSKVNKISQQWPKVAKEEEKEPTTLKNVAMEMGCRVSLIMVDCAPGGLLRGQQP